MNVLFVDNIEKSYGIKGVLEGCRLQIRAGERIGLVGSNGSGKSTLLRIIHKQEKPDHGTVQIDGSVAFLAQNPALHGRTVEEAVSQATQWHHQLLQDYEQAIAEGDLVKSSRIQDRLDMVGWNVGHNIASYLDRLHAPPGTALTANLSGGEARRVALARTLLSGADLLILDEPTNHLDVQAIEWLETYLRGYRGAVLFVTHDRYLLEKVATAIVEIEDGKTVPYEGSYGDYLVARTQRQMMLQKKEERRLKMLALEAAWAARSPAARSTKQKARLQRLEQLQEQRHIGPSKNFDFAFHTEDRFGRVLLDTVKIAFGYDKHKPLFQNLSFSLPPKARLGIIGSNGCGKSTLLQMIAGQVEPQKGEILRAGRLLIGCIDQHRSGLKEGDTVFEAIAEGRDHVMVNGNYLHVASLLEKFLFSRAMFEQRVEYLSGGERARLLLAKLLSQGVNLLLLDEPTNDLDLLTLRALEEALLSFEGAVVFISHDRAFLDRIATTVLSFEPQGVVIEYADRSQAMAALARYGAEKTVSNTKSVSTSPPQKPSHKLSYKEKRELEELPEKIEEAESRQDELTALLSNPQTYKNPQSNPAALSAELEDLESNISQLYTRWEELSEREDN